MTEERKTCLFFATTGEKCAEIERLERNLKISHACAEHFNKKADALEDELAIVKKAYESALEEKRKLSEENKKLEKAYMEAMYCIRLFNDVFGMFAMAKARTEYLTAQRNGKDDKEKEDGSAESENGRKDGKTT